jgi:hypothetical protein
MISVAGTVEGAGKHLVTQKKISSEVFGFTKITLSRSISQQPETGTLELRYGTLSQYNANTGTILLSVSAALLPGLAIISWSSLNGKYLWVTCTNGNAPVYYSIVID